MMEIGELEIISLIFLLYFSILNMLLVLKSFKTMHQLVYGMRQILQYVALRV